MRFVTAFLFAYLALSGAVSHASDLYKVEKVKTGILPDGGFYSLYKVDCRDNYSSTIATVDGARGWCSLQNGALSCASSRQDAALSACMSGAVAAADENLNAVDQYQ